MRQVTPRIRRLQGGRATLTGGIIALLVLTLPACSGSARPDAAMRAPLLLPLHPEYLPQAAPDTDQGASFLQDFAAPHDPARWSRTNSNYRSEMHPAWLSRYIHFRPDRLELELSRRRVGDKRVAGAEYQRRGFYHFGRYEVVMRAAPGSGTVSAMFTHTHGQFDDPHDEIDIEFLGSDLREVTFNYFSDGAQHGLIRIPLPFDASREAHLYAFDWEPDRIRWYVGDTLVHTSTAEDHPIPQSPSRIILQLWSGSPAQFDWHGPPTFSNGTRAAYYCVSFQKAGDHAPQCSDTFDPAAARSHTGDR